MRPWTQILPAFVWLWLVRKHCEKLTIRGDVAVYNAGHKTYVVSDSR